MAGQRVVLLRSWLVAGFSKLPELVVKAINTFKND